MNRKRIVAMLLLLIVAAAVLYYTVYRGRGEADGLTASGTVEATEAALGFQVPGRIQRVVAREGDLVHAGDTLAWLDRAELDARLAQARAQLNAARALFAELRAGARPEELAQAREAARAARERHVDAQRDLERARTLLAGGAIAQEVVDKAQLAVDVAAAQRDQAEQQLKLVEAGPRQERIAAQNAAVAQAAAMVEQAEAALAHAVVLAPFDGLITVRDREPGETVGAGAPVLTLTDLGDRWVRIYIREDRIGAVQLGQNASVTSDTYPDKEYTGSVSFIASEAEFTPRNVQTTEERVKLVYAVKVRIQGDAAHELKPGMPADVRLTTASE